MISYEAFTYWHTAHYTDRISDKVLKAAYMIYKEMVESKGEDYADDKICGHPIWDYLLTK